MDALEAFSSLTGAPVLLVDLRAGCGDVARAALERTRSRLAELPCPTVAITGQALDEAGRFLLPSFDVAVGDVGQAADLARRIHERPLASSALVQLLRCNEVLAIHEGLIAESLTYSMLQAGPEFAAWLSAYTTGSQRPSETGASAEDDAARPQQLSGAVASVKDDADRSRKSDEAVALVRGGTKGSRTVSAEPVVLAERDGGRLRLILNRPERRNAFSAEMRDVLAGLLAVALEDPAVEEIVLAGHGPAFCSGGDLDEFGTLPDPATAHAIRSTRNVARMLAACGERLVAEVQGACVGAGVELAAFARRVRARDDATFTLPEVTMGLVPGAGGTVSIPRRIGRQRAAQMALTGDPIDARTALGWGLVDEIV